MFIMESKLLAVVHQSRKVIKNLDPSWNFCGNVSFLFRLQFLLPTLALPREEVQFNEWSEDA